MERFKNATLVVTVLGLLLAWSPSALAHCRPDSNGPHAEPDHPGCGDPDPVGTLTAHISYVGWGGPTKDKNVQIRFEVLEGGVPVEADVEFFLDICPSLTSSSCEELGPFVGTTVPDNNSLALFNITPAPVGCYFATDIWVDPEVEEDNITEDCFCKGVEPGC